MQASLRQSAGLHVEEDFKTIVQTFSCQDKILRICVPYLDKWFSMCGLGTPPEVLEGLPGGPLLETLIFAVIPSINNPVTECMIIWSWVLYTFCNKSSKRKNSYQIGGSGTKLHQMGVWSNLCQL